ncbi:probable transcription factor BIM2 [Coccomyxa sp. Obi]|nr:probable transcription factor BIM2 [Coccomyxa sp. Obi]
MEGAKPLRPVPQIPDLQQVMDAARVSGGLPAQQTALQNSLASLANLRSAFTPMVPTQAPMYPEIALFSQFNQLLPGMAELAQQQQLLGRNAEPAASRGRTKSNDSKSSSAYASRHQAAEQRRRTRINERLDRLRQVVPHAERANTASFLEEVITYIQGLQKRIAELEQAAAGGQAVAQSTNVQAPAISAGFMTQAGFSVGPGVGQTPEAAPTASHHSQGAGAQGPCDARDKFSFPCTAAHPAQEVLPSAQPPNTQPGTPPAVSGGHASEAGGASPASSEGCGMPLKKRRVVEGGSG